MIIGAVVGVAWPHVVDLSPSLLGAGSTLTGSRRVLARSAHVPPGTLDMTRIAPEPDGWLGVLVIEGLILVQLEVGRARSGWLLGPDDLIRPWDLNEISLNEGTRWRALTQVQLALLDRDFGTRVGGIPAVSRRLVTSAARTTTWLHAKSLVLSSPVVEERLLLLFALLGERYGVVTSDGVLVKLSLTHALLANLCGARRPSVTMALSSLSATGVITRTAPDTWLLGREPAVLDRCSPSCWSHYTHVLGLEHTAPGGACDDPLAEDAPLHP